MTAPTEVRPARGTGTAPLLKVTNLRVEFAGRNNRPVRAVRGLTYEIAPGNRWARGRVGLGQERQRAVAAGPAAEEGQPDHRRRGRLRGPRPDRPADDEMRKIRGARIAMIFQDPLASLNPVLTIGRQITEALETHKTWVSPQRTKRAADLLTMVGIPGAARPYRRLPAPVLGRHAAARDDRDGPLLRARAPHRGRAHDGPRRDDPGADPGAAAAAQGRAGMAMLLITHDLGVVAGFVTAWPSCMRARSSRRADRADPGQPVPPLHARPAAVAAAPRPPPADGPDADRGVAARSRVRHRRLPVPAPLPVRRRGVGARRSAAAARRTEPLGRLLESAGPA